MSVLLVHISCPRRGEDEEITHLYFSELNTQKKKNKTMCRLAIIIFSLREVLTQLYHLWAYIQKMHPT